MLRRLHGPSQPPQLPACIGRIDSMLQHFGPIRSPEQLAAAQAHAELICLTYADSLPFAGSASLRAQAVALAARQGPELAAVVGLALPPCRPVPAAAASLPDALPAPAAPVAAGLPGSALGPGAVPAALGAAAGAGLPGSALGPGAVPAALGAAAGAGLPDSAWGPGAGHSASPAAPAGNFGAGPVLPALDSALSASSPRADLAASTLALRPAPGRHHPEDVVAVSGSMGGCDFDLYLAAFGERLARGPVSLAISHASRAWSLQLTAQADSRSAAGLWLALHQGPACAASFSISLLGQQGERQRGCLSPCSWRAGGDALGFTWADFRIDPVWLASVPTPWQQADGGLRCRVQLRFAAMP